MNFKGKSTFKRKWKQFGSLALKDMNKIKVTKHMFCVPLCRQVYTVMAWFVMCLQWRAFKLGFSPLKHQSFSWKISLNSCLIGFDQLYTRHAGGSSRGKALNKILTHRSSYVVNRWHSGNEMPQCVGGPEFDSEWNFFFSPLYFFFPFHLVIF